MELADVEPPVADAFESMDEFWAALADHSAGSTRGSVWDTYEAGERRELEQSLSDGFAAPSAVVVSSGMAAATVALLTMTVTTGTALAPAKWCDYFELTDLCQRIMGPLLGEARHSGTRIVEPVSNSPGLKTSLRAVDDADGPVIVDNSLFSWSVPWPEWRKRNARELLVFESIPKFLNREVSGGVIYGDTILTDHARSIARATGTLLHRRACLSVLENGIGNVRSRIAVHADRARAFAEELQGRRPDLVVRRPDALARAAGLRGADSALVFAIYPEDADCTIEFDAWAAACQRMCGRPMVRAGYGWQTTHARAYGNDPLNSDPSTAFVRFSIGLEEEAMVKAFAARLTRATAA